MLSVLGYNVDRDDRATLADDFNVTDPAGWYIEGFTFYAYQTNAPTTDSTLTNVNVRIWEGTPGLEGSRIVWGDVCTNLFNSSSWTGVLRASNVDPQNTLRLIMTLRANTPDLYLPQGTYWVEYQAQGTLVSGPWGIPIAILGQYGTGNARQYFPTNPGSGWKDLISGGSVADGFTGNLWPQGIPFLIHAGEASSSEPGVTGYACLPETAPLLPGSSADSPEACIAACGAALAPNNAAYFANLYGTGNDTCGTFCTCAGTCQDKRLVAGQTYPVCYAPNVFEATTTTNKKHTGRVLRGGMVRFTLKLRQNVAGTLDTLGAGLGVRFRVTPTDEISERFQLRSKVTPKPAGYAAKSKVADLTTEEGATVVTWPALGLAAKKTYTFSVTFRVSKAAPSGTEFLLHAELFQAGISGVPPYCVRELGSRTLTVK